MAASESKTSDGKIGDREIVIERTVNAPRDLVWRALTEADHVALWWGPNGFTNTIDRMDVKVGGEWRFTMHGPDGTDYPNLIVYREVRKPEYLAYDHSDGKNPPQQHFSASITLQEAGATKTKVTLRSIFPTAMARQAVMGYAVEGGKQTLGRLDAYAEATDFLARPFRMSRRFDAPREMVFRAWGEAEALRQWWGPKGADIEVAKLEFRPGGFFHYAMKTPGGAMWGRFMYREIVAPERICWINSFSNEGCGVTRAPFNALIPLEFENTIELIPQGGLTWLNLRSVPLGATDEERNFVEGFHVSLSQGFGGTFDALAAYLAKG